MIMNNEVGYKENPRCMLEGKNLEKGTRKAGVKMKKKTPHKQDRESVGHKKGREGKRDTRREKIGRENTRHQTQHKKRKRGLG